MDTVTVKSKSGHEAVVLRESLQAYLDHDWTEVKPKTKAEREAQEEQGTSATAVNLRDDDKPEKK